MIVRFYNDNGSFEKLKEIELSWFKMSYTLMDDQLDKKQERDTRKEKQKSTPQKFFFLVLFSQFTNYLEKRVSSKAILNGWKIKYERKFSVNNYKIMNWWVKKILSRKTET